MNEVRCGAAADRNRICPGCGDPYPDLAPPSAAELHGRSSSRFANRLLTILGVIAGAGLIGIAAAPDDEGSMIAAALASIPVFILLCVVFVALALRAGGRSWIKSLGAGVVCVFTCLGAIVAAYILVTVACAAGGIR